VIDLDLDADQQARNAHVEPAVAERCYICELPLLGSSKRLKVHELERWAMAEEGEPHTIEPVGPECWKRVHAIVAARKPLGASS
jgi:hypothetical protein